MIIPKIRIDIVIGVSALIVSAASLATIIRHAVIMEKMLTADTLPFLELENGNVLPDQTRSIYFELRNSGVGPARVEKFTLFFDGSPVPDWYKILEVCCGLDRSRITTIDEFNEQVGFVVTAPAAPTMLASSNSRYLFRWDKDSSTNDIYDRFDAVRARISAQACYCSVFEDCWKTDFQSFSPQPVAACNAPDK